MGTKVVGSLVGVVQFATRNSSFVLERVLFISKGLHLICKRLLGKGSNRLRNAYVWDNVIYENSAKMFHLSYQIKLHRNSLRCNNSHK